MVIPFAPVDRSAMYLRRSIEAGQDTTIVAHFGSDDGIQVWINGAIALENNASRGCAPDQDAVSLPLRQGTNLLLVKISNGSGDTGFYFSLTPTEPAGLVAPPRTGFPRFVERATDDLGTAGQHLER